MEQYISLLVISLWIFSSIKIITFIKNLDKNESKYFIMYLLNEYGFKNEYEKRNNEFYRLLYLNLSISCIIACLRIISVF